MPEPPVHPETTEDYRQYAKGPNFKAILIGAAIVMILLMIATVLILHSRAKTLLPARQTGVAASTVTTG